MSYDFAAMTPQEATAALFDRWRNRPVAPLPKDEAGNPIPRPRPIIDAIKGAGSSLIGQLFTSLGPMLIPFLTQLLQQKLGSIVTPADEDAAKDLAVDRQLADVLVSRLPAQAAAIDDPAERTLWDACRTFLLAMIDSLDPKEAVAFLISLLSAAWSKTTTQG